MDIYDSVDPMPVPRRAASHKTVAGAGVRYLEEVATDEEDGEEEEENEKELELEEKDDVDNGDKEEEGGKEEEADEGQPYDELVGLNRPPFCNCNQFTCECSPLDSCDDIFADS